MLSLSTALKQNHTTSTLSMRSALSSQRSSVTELLQTNLIYQGYLNVGGRNGYFGYPTSEVHFLGAKADRQFRGGQIQVLGGKVQMLPSLVVSIHFLGFRCVQESSWDQSSPHDEPYFIISVDPGNGTPTLRKFEYTNVDTGTEMSDGSLLIANIAPNPMALRVIAYEKDFGDPDATAKNIQDEVVTLSQQAQSLASAADAADGPGIGPAAGAGTIGAIAGGPLGALVAAGIVSVLGLGDDFVGQAAKLLFSRPEDVGTPPKLGDFQDMPFNQRIHIDGGDEGIYDLYFDVLVLNIPPPTTAGG
jgi:hypothetical protein